jgi:hypothetical protein
MKGSRGLTNIHISETYFTLQGVPLHPERRCVYVYVTLDPFLKGGCGFPICVCLFIAFVIYSWLELTQTQEVGWKNNCFGSYCLCNLGRFHNSNPQVNTGP